MSGAATQSLGPLGGTGIERGRRFTPQRVHEDPDGSSGGPYVLHFAARNPVVDRPSADADELTGARNRDGLALQRHHSVVPRSARQRPDPPGSIEVFRPTLS